MESSRSGLRPVLGPYEELSDVVQRGNIDQVFVALDRSEPSDPLKHVESLYETNASIRVVPDLLDLHTVRCSTEDFDGHCTQRGGGTPQSSVRRARRFYVIEGSFPE